MADFNTYLQLRNTTRDKAQEAQGAATAEATAQAALTDAEAALAMAKSVKAEAYDAWQKAERAENAEAIALGIDPNPVTPTV